MGYLQFFMLISYILLNLFLIFFILIFQLPLQESLGVNLCVAHVRGSTLTETTHPGQAT